MTFSLARTALDFVALTNRRILRVAQNGVKRLAMCATRNIRLII